MLVDGRAVVNEEELREDGELDMSARPSLQTSTPAGKHEVKTCGKVRQTFASPGTRDKGSGSNYFLSSLRHSPIQCLSGYLLASRE